MCGIAGLLREGKSDGLGASIRAMCDAIVHRGPDDAGYVVRGPAALGMRRLSIIDVAGGHQPIPNEDESVWIVFNGEIYNHHELRGRLERAGHRFRTRSDTEVILHGYEEWGDDVARELHGMFGFAIWDERRHRLLAARDHLGIKPLYYWPTPDGVGLCSELRSFVALPEFPRELSREALVAYLALGYVPQPLSIFASARKLPPGHRLSWTAERGVEVSRYWDPLAIRAVPIAEQDAVDRLRVLLGEAVESHLESEVPLGAFLSGGLDSSTVVALMCRAAGGRVRTFSVGFAEEGFNESEQAAMVARALGTEHTAVTLRPSAEVLIDRVVQLYDEPFADSSAMPTWLVSTLAREHVTVSLSGDGGDELFAGYTRYPETLGAASVAPPFDGLARAVGRALPHIVPGRNRLIDMGRPRHARFNQQLAAPLAPEEGGVLARAEAAGHDIGSWFSEVWGRTEGRDLVSRMTLVDLSYYLPGDILTKVDRASMAVSLEARVPLLHVPLVEFALSLPGSLKLRDGTTKYVFRRAIEGIVPPEVLSYPKRGFAVPLGRWLRQELRPALAELDGLHTEFPGLFERSAVQRLVREHLMGRRDHSHRLWNLVVLRRWMRHLRDGDLGRAVPRLQLADLGVDPQAGASATRTAAASAR
jgi:asparagine synthase (glutamine-hydrolysing)